ncbi:sodium-independent sulfate anion transporter isoform X4 [Cryptotermes secundus]|uniref:sodium-independent sulfate anion transporter isoform X4 n=1 Tax=Cryptotermes secundus TaxID=105785 RepID=UPI000CD7CC08|nr:sodium-independent sulfate anion transporter isoform X4 [Cryptotermes secundus]
MNKFGSGEGKNSRKVITYLEMKNKILSTRITERVFRHINILNWLPQYSKQDGIGDFIAGITVGLTMMPQSIAYASLAGLSPQFGLYSAFFGSYLYVVFGTIKEVSIGPTAVMSLLTYEFTNGLGIEYIVLLTFLAGCVELIMGLLNLGFLIDFISTPVISGFTSAYSVIIIVSQLKSLFGLRKFKTKGFIDNISKLAVHLHETKIWDAALGIFCIIFLLILRKAKDVHLESPGDANLTTHQKKIKKCLWFISISRNTIIVLVSAVLAFLFETAGLSPFILSGQIESGLPPFHFPAFSIQENNSTITFPEMCSELGLGIIVIPVVAILANVAIAKAFATGPSFDATQEMLTLGVCNIFGSCVCSMPTCGAFTRSAVSSASGARTPMVGLYSERDLFLVVLTFVSCLGLGVEIGLLIGVVTNVIFLLYLWARPTVSIITCKTPTGGEYVMVTPDSGLMYLAVDFLCTTVTKAGINQGSGSLPLVINCTYIKGMDYTTAMALKVVYRTFQKRQQPLILFNVRTGIKSMLQTTADVKMILYADTEKEIVDLIFGEILDLERSETIPLIEKGTQEHEVTIEIETGCIDDLIQDTLASNESSLNECGRDK